MMFRFLRITTWASGHRWLDIGGLSTAAYIERELQSVPLWRGESTLGASAWEFIIYDGSC